MGFTERMSNLPPGVSDADIERHFGTDSPEDEAAMQEALEDMAHDEAVRFAPAFIEYLFDREDWRGGPATEVLRCVFRDFGKAGEWSARVQIQRSIVVRDWIAYRTSTATVDERAEALRSAA